MLTPGTVFNASSALNGLMFFKAIGPILKLLPLKLVLKLFGDALTMTSSSVELARIISILPIWLVLGVI